MVSRRRRMCYVVSSEMTLNAFLAGHISVAARAYDVSVVMNTQATGDLRSRGIPADLLRIRIERAIAPWRDLCALWELYRSFRRARFDLVHSVSPKAGLLGMLAARLARTPVCIHTFTGQVWAAKTGWRRAVLKGIDRLLAVLTTHALVDSPSQRDFLVAEGVLSAAKATVIGNGAICGVNADRFKPDSAAFEDVRCMLDIPRQAVVLLFVGRIGRDKGVLDLAAAFARMAARRSELFLLLVGPDEQRMIMDIRTRCGEAASRLRYVDLTPAPERYMAAADILCLPSYREGFGMVVIEAAATGLPAVASRIYGITDAVVDGLTGLLHSPGDVPDIERALGALLDDATVRREMGEAARQRALADFSPERITGDLMVFYGKMLSRSPMGSSPLV